jgi:hypothetical protein
VVNWVWVAASVDGHALGELTHARARALSFDLRGPCTVKFTLNGRSDQARELDELVTDLHALRDRQLLFRGRLGSTDDDLGSDRHTTNWSALDYRGLLGGRHDRTGRTYDAWQQADIGWDLVQIAQAGAGGPLGITRGTNRAAAVARTETVDADTPIDTVQDRFQDYENGFEWWISPDLAYQQATWRGVDHPDFPLVWGTTATSVKRSYDTGLYANWVRVRGGRPEGADQETPEFVADRQAPGLAGLRQGRIERVHSNSELTSQQAVNAAADQLLADSLNPPAAYTVVLTPGLWQGPADVWLGDRVPLIVRSGRLDIDATARVNQLDIDLDEEGSETVTLTVGVGDLP